MKRDRNGQPGPKPQQQPPPVFLDTAVFTDNGDFNHAYAQHNIQMGPEGGMLIVSETREDKRTFVYPISRLKRLVLTPTKLELT